MNASTNDPKNEKHTSPDLPHDLAFDPKKGTFALDVNDNDPDWDHPADYETVSEGAKDDNSTYDNSNPLVGDEYADQKELRDDAFDDAGIRIVRPKDLRVSKLDEELSKTEEDYRDDLDAEGYPKNI